MHVTQKLEKKKETQQNQDSIEITLIKDGKDVETQEVLNSKPDNQRVIGESE